MSQELEEKIAHLEKALAELSDVVAAQDRAITLLEQRVEMLRQREAQREAEATGGVVLGDERPPHY